MKNTKEFFDAIPDKFWSTGSVVDIVVDKESETLPEISIALYALLDKQMLESLRFTSFR